MTCYDTIWLGESQTTGEAFLEAILSAMHRVVENAWQDKVAQTNNV
jgi:hypothetical protein